MDVRDRRPPRREAHRDAVRTEHRLRRVPLRRAADRAACTCGRSLTFRLHDGPLGGAGRRGRSRWSSSAAAATRCSRGRRAGAAPLPAPALGVFVVDERTSQRDISTRSSATRGYDVRRAISSRPGYFVLDLGRARPCRSSLSTEPWELLTSDAQAVFDAERQRMQKLIALAPRAAREGLTRAAHARRRPVHRPTRHPPRGERARACVRRRGADRDRRLSLVRRLGPRHDDQPGRPDALHRPLSRGAAPSCARSPTTCRTACCPISFPKASARRSTTRPTRRCGTSTRSTAIVQKHAATRTTLATLFPVLESIVEHHVAGTRFGIGVDPEDGLLAPRRPGISSRGWTPRWTDWVVTPRRGKPVEIQALWYNALRADGRLGAPRSAARTRRTCRRAGAARTARSTSASGTTRARYLYDVVDGEDGRTIRVCRPNQIFALSLRHPDPRRAPLAAGGRRRAAAKLLTPYGLRTLDPAHPDYRPRLRRRPPGARRRLPSGYGVAVAHRARSSTRGAACIADRQGARRCCSASRSIT